MRSIAPTSSAIHSTVYAGGPGMTGSVKLSGKIPGPRRCAALWISIVTCATGEPHNLAQRSSSSLCSFSMMFLLGPEGLADALAMGFFLAFAFLLALAFFRALAFAFFFFPTVVTSFCV